MIKQNISHIIIIIFGLFVFLSLWNRNYYIGGDLIFPIKPADNLVRYFYTWEEVNAGRYFFNYMHLAWQFIFYFLTLIKIPPDIGIKIYILLLYFLGVVFTYLSYREIFHQSRYDNKYLAIFAAAVFMFNPGALLVVLGFHPLYVFPACLYFLLKFLNRKKFLYLIPLALFFSIGYLPDLPQAKYFVVFSLSLICAALINSWVRKEKIFNTILGLITAFIFLFLINAYLLLPFINNAFLNDNLISNFSKTVTSYNGEVDIPSAALPFTQRFFNTNLINESTTGKFLHHPVFIIWSFVLWIFIFIALLFEKDKQKKRLCYLLLGITWIVFFLAKGANPPFGFIYKFLVLNIPVFKIFRTTSTVAIAGIFFYAILLALSAQKILHKSKKIFFIFLVFNIVLFYPVYLMSNSEKTISGNIQKGITIPAEYSKIGSLLNNLSDNRKILAYPLTDGYSNKDWGYMGISLVGYLTHKPLITSDYAEKYSQTSSEMLKRLTEEELCLWFSMHSVGYLLEEKDSNNRLLINNAIKLSKSIYSDQYFNLLKIKDTCVYPQVYTPASIYNYAGNPLDLTFLPEIQEKIIASSDFSKDDADLSLIQVTVVQGKSSQVAGLSLPTGIVPNGLFVDTSNYEFDLTDSGDYYLSADKPELIKSIFSRDNNYILNNQSFYLKGKHHVTVNLQEEANLLGDWFYSAAGGYSQLQPPSNPALKNPVIFQNINNWEKGNTYLLEISLIAGRGRKIGILIDETKEVYNGRNPVFQINQSPLVADIIGAGNETKVTYLLKSDINSLGARLYISNLQNKTKITNISLKKITYPKLFLIERTLESTGKKAISYKKINPTKYEVTIPYAKQSKLIVLSENFNNGWRIIGKKTGEQYQTDDVRHVQTNGFSNGWIVNHKILNKKENKFIIEFFPQQLINIGAIISVISIIIIITLDLFLTVRYRNYKNNNV